MSFYNPTTTTTTTPVNASSSNILPSRPIHPHIQTNCPSSTCKAPLEYPIPSPPPRVGTSLQIRCFACQTVFGVSYPPPPSAAARSSFAASPTSPTSTSFTFTTGTTSSSSGATTTTTTTPPISQPTKKTRLIGTQDRPLETGYYDLLNVLPTSTTDEIKRSYRRLAIKHHPDKNLSDPSAAERFKEISIAYQTLVDPALRKKYNEFGAKASAPEGGFVDPEEVFSAMFGGERFVPIIGSISLAREMKAAMQEGEEEQEELQQQQQEGRVGSLSATSGTGGQRDSKGREILSDEERAARDEKARRKAAEKSAARESRISTLTTNLSRKLSIFTESASGLHDRDVAESWRQICAIEAEELKHESYGYELLQTIGFVYVAKAKHFMATNQTLFGVGGWLHNVQGKYHVFSETVSTLRSAIELKSVFDQIQAAEKAGNLTPEEKRKLEEQAAEKGLQALFKGTKLEVESVLRDVCDRVLGDAALSRDQALLRAIALQMLGDAYMTVKRDPGSPPGLAGILGSMAGGGNAHAEESEYVRVETKASRDRARAQSHTAR